MTRLIRRAARTSPQELWHRSIGRLRASRDALRVMAGRDRWDRARLAPLLSPDLPATRAARRALDARDWRAADSLLRAHLTQRPRQFVVNPADRGRVAAAVTARHPSAPLEAGRRACRLLQHRYDLLGYRDLHFGTADAAIDWHADPVHARRAPATFWSRVPYLDPALGDHKIIWELNRHQHWLALGRAAWLTGDEGCAAGFERELDSWLRANPPLVGINWSSMLELAFRSISWVWALHLFADSRREPEGPWAVDLLMGLARQLDHVAGHLSTYFSPNTHLLGEGLALYVAGRALPELTSSGRWARTGRRILIHESTAQILPDGGHAELSTHYHRYALDFYLLALVVARRTDDPAAGRFAETVSRLAAFCRAMAGDDQRLPLIGDDDGGMLFPMCGRAADDVGDSLALAAALLDRAGPPEGELPEEAIWMLAGELPPPGGDAAAARRPAPGARLFPDTGYAVLRTRAAHAILDAGPHGFLNGGHAHADALSLVLSIDGRRLLIDPGTGTYTMDRARRDRFRSTAMHNTLTLDERSQSVPDGAFHWASRARARVDLWRPGSAFDHVEASHDGYLPLVHRRSVLRVGERLWLIADHVLGAGRHEAGVHWHLGPEWLPDGPAASETGVTHRDGARAALASTAACRAAFHGDAAGIGWWAPVYGRLEPALTIRCSGIADAPFSWVTAIAAGAAAEGLESHPVDLAAGAPDDDWHRAAARLAWNGGTALALFATPLTGTAPSAPPRRIQRIAAPDGEFITDARAAFLQFSGNGDPACLVALDCSLVQWTGRGAFHVSPSPGERDLHRDRRALGELSRAAAPRPVG